jgi:alpha-tubulin suppressor-like RCC1 family protein
VNGTKAILVGVLLLAIPQAAVAKDELVSTGADLVTMIRSDGSVWAWGYSSYGLGDGVTTRSTTPVQVVGIDGGPFLTGAVSVSTNGYSTVVLLSDGTVASWGQNHRGQLGDGTIVDRRTPARVKGPGGIGILSNIIAVANGGASVAALAADGKVYTWGVGYSGQLGTGLYPYPTGRSTPQLVTNQDGSALAPITAIAAGSEHMLAVAADGSVYAWGGNADCSSSSANYCATGCGYGSGYPCRVRDSSGTGYIAGVTAVATTRVSSVALTANGSVYAWGANNYGQLGNGSIAASLYPVAVLGFASSGVTDVACGVAQCYARRNDGTVAAWGYNHESQLGATVYSDTVTTPVLTLSSPSTSLSGIANVFSGHNGYSGFAFSGSGLLFGWGLNNYCQTLVECNASSEWVAVPGTSRLH